MVAYIHTIVIEQKGQITRGLLNENVQRHLTLLSILCINDLAKVLTV